MFHNDDYIESIRQRPVVVKCLGGLGVEINRKTYGGLILVIAYLNLLRGGFEHIGGLLTSLLFCIVAVMFLKDKEQRWYENKWFKGYVSVQVLIFTMFLYGVVYDLKLDWLVPDGALYARLYHSSDIGFVSMILYFITWFVFTYCYINPKKHWFARWHMSIWVLIIFIVWNMAMLNHYQYVDEDSIHSNGLFSSTTISLDKVWMMRIEPKIKTSYRRTGNKEQYLYYDLSFYSREGKTTTFKDMLLTEKDIHAAVMLANKLEESDREVEARVGQLILMSSEVSTMLEKRLNEIDEELAVLFRETFMDDGS